MTQLQGNDRAVRKILCSLEDLDITLGRINELQTHEEEDEYGEVIKPTDSILVKTIYRKHRDWLACWQRNLELFESK